MRLFTRIKIKNVLFNKFAITYANMHHHKSFKKLHFGENCEKDQLESEMLLNN